MRVRWLQANRPDSNNKMKTIKLICILGLFGLTSCDPVHTLYLENQANHNILVQTEKGGKYHTLFMDSVIRIGHCVAHYEPRLDDMEIEYLKIVSNSDTVVLPEKTAIFSMLKKVGSLDWRIIYKDK